jgi:hypothetical protein
MKQFTLPILILSSLSFLIISCHKEIKPEKGGMDIISNVYFEASKGLEQTQSFHVSKINYQQNNMIEIVPNFELPEMNKSIYFINDSVYYNVKNDEKTPLFSELKKQKPFLVWKKEEGALFSKEWIPNYINRKNISDTILFNKKYKRFEVDSPWSYSRFYIYPTDTILPYSIYKHAETDYKGRLERIDSYNKKTDIFVSLQLIPRKKWDAEAEKIFKFNSFK